MTFRKTGWVVLLSAVFALSKCQNDVSRKDIRIGVIQQLTGQMSKYGKTQVAAVTAMSEVINKQRNETKAAQIKLIVDDDQLQPSRGVSIIEKMISTDKVVAVIGAQGSSVTLAMAPIAEKNKVVLISGASGSPKISDAGDFIFRTCPSDVYEGEFIARVYGKMFKGRPLALMYINNDYGIGLRNAFLRNLSQRPLTVLDLAFQQGATDFRSQLSKIKEAKIEVVYLVGYEEMIAIFKQAKEFGLKCGWLGNNQLNDQSMIDKMGTTSDGTIFPGHKFDLDHIKSSYPQFYKRYLDLSGGEELDMFAAYGVDALLVINDALLKGARTGEGIKDALYRIKDFEGITGKFSFNEKGDAIRELALYQIENGKIVKYEE
jgi:branched-chain amino acid transport system substrate-binding protein